MRRHTLRLWKLGAISLLVLWATFVPVNAQSQRRTYPGQPGSINYVEGQVLIGSKVIDSKSVGSAGLKAGQSIRSEQGKVEILLTPGAFLRLGENSSVKMISSGMTNTEMELQEGRAIVEVAEIHHDNNLRVDLNGVTTQLLKTGLYDFDLDRHQIRVFDGKARVQENGMQVEVKEGRELDLNARGSLK